MAGLRQILGDSLASRRLRLFGRREEGDREEVNGRGPVAAAEEPVAEPQPLARSTNTLAEVSRELAGWVPILRRLAEAEALRDLALGHCSEITSPAVRSIIAARRLRDEYFWPSMNEAAWAVLLELYANRVEGRRIDVAGLSAATGLPPATCLHWLDWLAGRGMIFRDARAADDESALIDLTDAGADEMRAYLLASLRISPWVQ